MLHLISKRTAHYFLMLFLILAIGFSAHSELLLANTPPCGLNYTDISATASGPSASVSSLPASQVYDFAVMFQTSSDTTVGGVSLYLKKAQEASGTFEITIKSSLGGVPGSILASASVPLSSISNASYSWVEFNLASSLSLSAGSYWVTGTVKAGTTVTWYAIMNSDYCSSDSAKQRTCSLDLPNYCSETSGWGSWSNTVSNRKPLFIVKTTYTPPQTCSDSTPYNQCSQTKPKYCENGVLVNKCSVCGCTSDLGCQPDETCAAPTDISIKNLLVQQTTKNSSVVSFTTQTASYGEVIYGSSCTHLTNKLTESTSKTTHTFSLTQLMADTIYYYQASSKLLPTDTSGQASPCNNFKTLADNQTANQTIQRCTDGTQYGTCSQIKPKYCENGLIADKCSTCGCSTNYVCDAQTQLCKTAPENKCTDGTKYNECSQTKPKFCDGGTLVDKCSVCRCVEGYVCNTADEKCKEKTNNPPVAIAGDDIFTTVNTPVTFDASKSYDPDGDALTYTWVFPDTPIPVNEMTYQRAFAITKTYDVILEVSDGKLKSTDTIKVVVEVIQPPVEGNLKKMVQYQDGLVFVISDENWRDVLSLVPIGVWEDENGLHKYPLLVYHKETEMFDSEAMINFLNHYAPTIAMLIGSSPQELLNQLVAAKPVGAGLQASQLISINPSDYFSYWQSFNTVAIVDYDNYEAGLMAVVYASHKNIPIIFVNSNNLDAYKNILSTKKIIVVGALDAATQNYISQNNQQVTSHSLAELQQLYVQETNTDKVILVNPNDLKFNLPWPEGMRIFSGVQTTNAHYANSLAAPILAASKKEVILFANMAPATTLDTEAMYNQVDGIVESEVQRLFGSNYPKYLTIIAPPAAIPDSIKHSLTDTCSYLMRLAVDWTYGSMDDVKLPETILYTPNYPEQGDYYPTQRKPFERYEGNIHSLVGRIYGYTTTDISAYIANSVFFDVIYSDLYKNSPSVLLASCLPELKDASTQMANLHSILKANGYGSLCYTYYEKQSCIQYCQDDSHKIPLTEAEEKQFILYNGHGGPAGIRRTLGLPLDYYGGTPKLHGTYVFAFACNTLSYFWKYEIGGESLPIFGSFTLRKGAIAYTGAVSTAWGFAPYVGDPLQLTTQGDSISIGEIDKEIRNYLDYKHPLDGTDDSKVEYNRAFILLGDPTIQIKAKEVNWQ